MSAKRITKLESVQVSTLPTTTQELVYAVLAAADERPKGDKSGVMALATQMVRGEENGASGRPAYDDSNALARITELIQQGVKQGDAIKRVSADHDLRATGAPVKGVTTTGRGRSASLFPGLVIGCSPTQFLATASGVRGTTWAASPFIRPGGMCQSRPGMSNSLHLASATSLLRCPVSASSRNKGP